MENVTKQLFINDLVNDLSSKIIALKKEQQVFNTLDGLKILREEDSQKDEVMVILDKLQAFAMKQITKEIKVYEEVILELRKIDLKEKDIETKGGVS